MPTPDGPGSSSSPEGSQHELLTHQWQQGLAQLLAYVAGHGTAAVPRTHVTSNGFKLGSWAAERRHEMKQGELTAARAAILQRLPGWRW